jgi:hypothetical protein
MNTLTGSEMIEKLRTLLDELCSDDLTLGRAKLLRSRLLEIVAELEDQGGN